MSKKSYRIKDAANILGVSTKTLRRWEASGKFTPNIRTTGNQRVYSHSQLQDFKNNLPANNSNPVPHVLPLSKPSPVKLSENFKPTNERLTVSPYYHPSADRPASSVIKSFQKAKFLSQGLSLAVLFFLVGGTVVSKYHVKGIPTELDPNETSFTTQGKVLAAQTPTETFNFQVAVPSLFKETATFRKEITAPNLITEESAGTGIKINKDEETGFLTISGNQSSWGSIAVTGQTSLTPSSSTSALTFAGSSGISITTSSTDNKLTISASSSDLNVSGWTDGGDNVNLKTEGDKVGIGTASPSYKLHVSGTFGASGAATFSSTGDFTGALNLTGNSLTSTGDLIIDATGGGVKIGTGTPATVDLAGDDLYVAGDMEVVGTIYGNISSDGGSIDPGFTTGSVVFQGASGLAENNSKFYWNNTNYRLGIGTTSPRSTLDIDGDVTLSNGHKILPDTDLGNDLGSSSYRFNNLWVANINSNSSQSFSGQTTFSYAPTDATITQASTIINPTTSAANGFLTAWAIAGYQRAGVDEDGDMTLGYLGDTETSAPASDYPLSIYNHGETRIAYFDTAGNLNIGGSIISGSGITATGDFTIASGYSIIPSADAVNAISIGNAASTDFISFDTSNSRMGVGTTNPAYLLDVAGTLNATTYMIGGTALTSNGAELNYLDGTTATNGGIVFGNGTYLTQDATNFFWDDTNNKLGVGTTTPSGLIHVLGTSEQMRLGYDASNYTSLIVTSDGTLTFYDTGNNILSMSDVNANFAVPTTFSAAGDVDIAYDLIFSNQNIADINSYGPLSINSGESFENNNLTLKTYGTGDLVADLTGTGKFILNGTDSSIIFDTRTATDTDFWMGITEDAGGDDDDYFSIGEGIGIGTSHYFTINTSGNVGVGTTVPTKGKLNILGSLAIGSTAYTETAGAAPSNGLIVEGNVGIGTTSPSQKFQVLGNMMLSATTPTVFFGNDSYIELNSSNLHYRVNTSFHHRFTNGGTTSMIINGSNNIGMGTTIPTSKLAIAGGVAIGTTDSFANAVAPTSGLMVQGNVGIGTTSPIATLDVASGTNSFLQDIRFVEDTGINYIQSTNNRGTDTWQPLFFGAGFSTTDVKLAIGTSGDIGIGTTSPTTDLDIVNGVAYSRINAGDANFTASSSRFIKENFIEWDSTGILDKINAIPVYTFDYINGPKDKMGLVAEDFYTIFGRGNNNEINYQEVSMALWLGIKELTKQLSEVQTTMGITPITANTDPSAPITLPENASFNSLTVSGISTLGDTTITGVLTAGLLSIDGLNNSINATGVLKLQDMAIDNIEMMAGKVVINTKGNIEVKTGVIVGNDQMRGSVPVVLGATTINIEKTWESSPNTILTTPSFPTKVWITNKSDKGFTINFDSPAPEGATIDWMGIW